MNTLPLAIIRRDGGTQPRAEIDADHVFRLMDAITAPGSDIPPVTVYYDGTDYWLADGFHRCAAYEQAGQATVPCEILPGTRRDAILWACGANAGHGLPRSEGDKRRAVELLLADAEWGSNSNHWIAKASACDEKYVRAIRGARGSPPKQATPAGTGEPAAEQPGAKCAQAAKMTPSTADMSAVEYGANEPRGRLGQDGKRRDLPVKAGERDPLYARAAAAAVKAQRGSVSFIQAQFQVGYTRARRIVDQLIEGGVLGEPVNGQAHRVLVPSLDQLTLGDTPKATPAPAPAPAAEPQRLPSTAPAVPETVAARRDDGGKHTAGYVLGIRLPIRAIKEMVRRPASPQASWTTVWTLLELGCLHASAASWLRDNESLAECLLQVRADIAELMPEFIDEAQLDPKLLAAMAGGGK